MDELSPAEVVTVELDCDGWSAPYARDITRRQLGELLLKLDDMGDATEVAQEEAAAEPWPTLEEAYVKAPSVISEIGWTANAAIGRPTYALLGREFWLRKAAVLDRVAHADESRGITGDAAEAAVEAARRLMDLDSADAAYDPRAYVRQQYALWAKTH